MNHVSCTYIVSSLSGTLYIGVTNNIERRMREPKSGNEICGATAEFAVEESQTGSTHSTLSGSFDSPVLSQAKAPARSG